MSTKRQVQKAATKKRIVKAAYKIYGEMGFAAPTSLIAKEAGISHGSVFVHFPASADLLTCVLQEFGSALGVRLHELAAGGNSMEDMLEAHLDALEEYEGFYKRLITESRLLPESSRSIFAAIQSVLSLHFSQRIKAGIDNGEIKKIPLHILFNTWVGLIHYYLQNDQFFSPESSVIKRCRAELIRSYLEMIKL